MGRLAVDDWTQRDTLATQEVEIPELGGSVLVRELPGSYSINNYYEVENPGTAQARPKLNLLEAEIQQFLIAVVEPQFTEDQVRDLFKKHGSAVRRVIDASDKLSSLDKEGVEQTAARFPGSGDGPAGQNGSGEAPEGDARPDLPVPVGGEVGNDGD